MREWKSSKQAGVQYRAHPERKRGAVPDRYFRVRYMVGGKRRVVGLGWASEGWTETSAFTELQRLRRNAKKGEGPTTLREEREQNEAEQEQEKLRAEEEERNNVTFRDFFNDTYSPNAKTEKKEGSCHAEEILFRLWIAPVIGEKPLREIVSLDLERMKKRMADKGKSPRTIQYALAVIRQVFNYAIRHGLVQENPATTVKKPKFENRRTRFLKQEEAQALLQALQKKSQSLYDQALLSLHTGMRAGEVFSLHWSDVHFDTGHILIRGETAKSGKDRSAYMTAQVREMLERRAKKPAGDLVFVDRWHKGQVRQVSPLFSRVVNDQGLNKGVVHRRDKVTFHTLRHTFASWLAMAGESLYTIKELLGHSTLALTERYSHLSPDSIRGASHRFEEALKPREAEEKVAALNGGDNGGIQSTS